VRRVDPNTFCRVSSETSRHLDKQADQEQFSEKPEFDPFDRNLMHDIGGTYWEQITLLLQTLHAIRIAERGFGQDVVNKARGFDMLKPQLQALEDACKRELEKP
jgi:hypothetical protein